jgi:hypothetical protein
LPQDTVLFGNRVCYRCPGAKIWTLLCGQMCNDAALPLCLAGELVLSGLKSIKYGNG